MHIILGSKSPRRKQLLEGLDIPFEVKTAPNVKEDYPQTMPAGEVPLFLSTLKADALKPLCQATDLIITSDTIVCYEGKIFEKPKSREEAIVMLKTLSGHSHQVITGVTFTLGDRQESFSDETIVHFQTLSHEEITTYIDRYKPYDKAGSYGVQEWIGYVGVSGIEGSYYNVMGFPVNLVYNYLKRFKAL